MSGTALLPSWLQRRLACATPCADRTVPPLSLAVLLLPVVQPLDPGLPPAEACWSAGAVLSHRGKHSRQQRHQGQHMMSMPPMSSAACYPGQLPPGSAMMQGPPGFMLPQQHQQAQVLVVNSLPACEAPGAPALNPGVPGLYMQQQPPPPPPPPPQQQQQQVVILQAGQGTSSPACPGGYATITMPMPMGHTGVLQTGGTQTAYVVPAQAVMPATPPQQGVQYSMQQQQGPAGQPTYILQMPDGSFSSSGTQMAAGQVVQVGVPVSGITTGSSLPAGQQAYLLDGSSCILQPQQQQAPAQGVLMPPMPQLQVQVPSSQAAAAAAPGAFGMPVCCQGRRMSWCAQPHSWW